MSQSLAKAVNILNCLSNGKNRFSEICRELKLPPATIHRLLTSMITTGLAFQDPVHRHYYLGPAILNLAFNPFSVHFHAVSIASDELKLLQSKTNETASLHALMGTHKICLDEHVSNEPIRYMIGKGEIGFIAGGASGKALLAQLDDAELELVEEKLIQLHKIKKEKYDLSVFKQIPAIRQQGFAESSGERQAGGMGISVPVKNYFCPLCISVMGPEDRITRKRETIIKLLKEASERLSKKLMSQIHQK